MTTTRGAQTDRVCATQRAPAQGVGQAPKAYEMPPRPKVKSIAIGIEAANAPTQKTKDGLEAEHS